MVNFLENVITSFEEKTVNLVIYGKSYIRFSIYSSLIFVLVHKAGYFRKKPCLNGSEFSKMKLENAVIYAVPNTRGITAL